MSHIQMIHVTRHNESRHTQKNLMSHTELSHVTDVCDLGDLIMVEYESSQTYKSVMSRIAKSHATHSKKQSYHT